MNILKNIQTQLKNFFTITGNYLDAIQRSISLTDYDGTESVNQSDVINSGYKTLTSGSDYQVFTPSITGYITAVELYFNQASIISDHLRIYITDIDYTIFYVVDGYPPNTPTGPQWIKLTFATPAILVAGTQYRLVMAPNGGGPFVLAYDTTGSYAGGYMGSDNTKDYDFRIYMQDTGVVAFTNGAITGITQDITNNSSQTLVASTESTSTYVLNAITTNAPYVQFGAPSSVNNIWYGLGSANLATFAAWTLTYEVTVMNATTCETSVIRFTIGWSNTASNLTQKYQIVSGSVSAIRPYFRIYANAGNTIIYPYLRVLSGNTFVSSIDRYITYPASYSFLTNLFYSYNGTGTDPTGVSSYTLKYDTTTNDAGLYAPKNVTISGPFTNQTVPIYFTLNGDLFTMTLSQMITTGNNTTDYITAPAGTIPDRYLPYGYSASNMPQVPIKINVAGNISYGSLNINTSLNGGFTIFADPNSAQFAPGTASVGFYNMTISWAIKNT